MRTTDERRRQQGRELQPEGWLQKYRPRGAKQWAAYGLIFLGAVLLAFAILFPRAHTSPIPQRPEVPTRSAFVRIPAQASFTSGLEWLRSLCGNTVKEVGDAIFVSKGTTVLRHYVMVVLGKQYPIDYAFEFHPDDIPGQAYAWVFKTSRGDCYMRPLAYLRDDHDGRLEVQEVQMSNTLDVSIKCPDGIDKDK